MVDTDNTSEYAITRNELVQAWNYNNTGLGTNPRAITPFRAALNAGDVLSRKNYSCGRQNQCFQSRPGLRGLKYSIGAAKNICDDSGIPSATCNTKFVYDGSDYTKFKKQLAVNKVFNLYTNGGNNSNAS
ncbi:MAG: hypothetical protein EBU61_05215, partial [Crocinitomicaceae bacterium]|nr:hypothetical protein [Crocinitomicaceae bacterium]